MQLFYSVILWIVAGTGYAYEYILNNYTHLPVLIKIDTIASLDKNIMIPGHSTEVITTGVRCVRGFEVRGPFGKGENIANPGAVIGGSCGGSTLNIYYLTMGWDGRTYQSKDLPKQCELAEVDMETSGDDTTVGNLGKISPKSVPMVVGYNLQAQ